MRPRCRVRLRANRTHGDPALLLLSGLSGSGSREVRSGNRAVANEPRLHGYPCTGDSPAPFTAPRTGLSSHCRPSSSLLALTIIVLSVASIVNGLNRIESTAITWRAGGGSSGAPPYGFRICQPGRPNKKFWKSCDWAVNRADLRIPGDMRPKGRRTNQMFEPNPETSSSASTTGPGISEHLLIAGCPTTVISSTNTQLQGYPACYELEMISSPVRRRL